MAPAANKRKVNDDSSSESAEAIAPKKQPAKKPVPSSDESSEEPPQKVAKTAAAKVSPAPKKAPAVDSDDSSDDEPAPKAAAKKVTPKVAPKKAPAADSDDSSDDEPAPKAAAKKATPKVAPKKAPAADSDDSSDDEPAPKAAAKKATPKVAPKKAPAADSDDSSDDEPAPKAAAKTPTPKAAPKKAPAADSDDSSDDDAAPKVKAVPKKAAEKDSDDSSDAMENAPPAKRAKVADEALSSTKNVSPVESYSGHVDPSSGLTVFIGGIPWSVDEATLTKDFSECGEMSNVKFLYNDDGKPRGIGFLTFSDKAGVEAALKYDGQDYHGRSLKVVVASDQGKGKGKGKDGKKGGKAGDWECPSCGDINFARNSTCRRCNVPRPATDKSGSGKDPELEVFVGGLVRETEKDQLMKDFSECGEIESLRMPLNEDGQCKGVAFINFKTKEGVDAALKFDGETYNGKWLKVNRTADEARDKGKDSKGKGKDGKGKDGKGKDGKGKGKSKGKKGKDGGSTNRAAHTGAMVESTGKKVAFDSDSE
eukprot:TRINITY_DN3992_c0_g1_i3.p1 TRINITY_DN3992_c0_g1~~TRINITY_DN3992_c0_g1_i3.p1  ORF type:complete len:537 (-),score=156.25 TRINITY_DN3992_c0_g1_i3:231-1841(-)